MENSDDRLFDMADKAIEQALQSDVIQVQVQGAIALHLRSIACAFTNVDNLDSVQELLEMIANRLEDSDGTSIADHLRGLRDR